MWTALTRRPDASLARCELTHLARAPIDVGRALAQHAAYRAALAELGLEVVELPPLAGQPDAAFVEDTAVVLDELAVLPRMGAASRRGEQESVARALAAHRPLERLDEPVVAAEGSVALDGGDVLRVDDALYVGRSTRTNHAGLKALAHLVLPHGYLVKAVEVRGCLHLKTACTYVGRDTLLVNRSWVNLERVRGLRLLDVHPAEPFAANALVAGETVLLAAEAPRTAERLEREGFCVRALDVSELAKAEAGPTCLSLVYRAGAGSSP